MTVLAGPDLLEVADGSGIVVDGAEGTVVLDPSGARSELAGTATADRARARARERADSSLPAVTADGRRIAVLVNAATPAEIRAGLDAGAEGAGLIRTELAFLDAPGWPSREQHAQMLAPLLAGLAGRTATVRVLDFGGDKLPPFLRAEPRRGIELLLAHPGAFRAQLAAIAQLAGDAEVRVLLPMVRTADDVRVTRAILDTLGGALALGAMIELPEAAAGGGGDSGRVRLPQHRDQRPHARDPRHRPLRPWRGAGPRSASARSHREHGPRGEGRRDPARGMRRGGVGAAHRPAARGPRSGRAERGRSTRGSAARLDPRARPRRLRAARAASARGERRRRGRAPADARSTAGRSDAGLRRCVSR